MNENQKHRNIKLTELSSKITSVRENGLRMKMIGLTQSSDLDEEVEIDNIEAKDEPSQQGSLFTAH